MLITLAVLSAGIAIGALIAWLVARAAQTTLRTELEKERAVHAERLKAYTSAELRLREAFQALSADALKSNNQAFLELAELRLREAGAETALDLEARKQA